MLKKKKTALIIAITGLTGETSVRHRHTIM